MVASAYARVYRANSILTATPGQLVLLADHINWTGASPVVGENDSRFGPRFFDMTEVYSELLRAQARIAAEQLGIDLREGVYLGVSGPNYETPAEIRAFRAMGADLVGMSVVHEAIVARQREPLQHPACDRRAEGPMETALRAIHDQPAQALRMVRGQFQGDRTPVRNPEDRRMPQP